MPAMVSHSAVDALRLYPRNLDVLQIIALARYGGVMGLILYPDFVITEPATTGEITEVTGHMVHIKKPGAIDVLALGSARSNSLHDIPISLHTDVKKK